MRVPAILYEFGQLKMGVVLIKWAWPKNFRAHYCYNATIVIILDPPLPTTPLMIRGENYASRAFIIHTFSPAIDNIIIAWVKLYA